MCAVVLVAFNSSGFSKKRRTLFKFDVALLITSITKKKKKREKYFTFFLICCLLTFWKNLCIAQKLANASLLITGAPPRRAPEPPCHAKQPSEGSLSLHFWCTSTRSPFFILMRCPAPFHFWYNVSRSAVSSFQPSFKKKKYKKISCGLLPLQKQACVHCKLTVRVVALILCSWRPRLL